MSSFILPMSLSSPRVRAAPHEFVVTFHIQFIYVPSVSEFFLFNPFHAPSLPGVFYRMPRSSFTKKYVGGRSLPSGISPGFFSITFPHGLEFKSFNRDVVPTDLIQDLSSSAGTFLRFSATFWFVSHP